MLYFRQKCFTFCKNALLSAKMLYFLQTFGYFFEGNRPNALFFCKPAVTISKVIDKMLYFLQIALLSHNCFIFLLNALFLVKCFISCKMLYLLQKMLYFSQLLYFMQKLPYFRKKYCNSCKMLYFLQRCFNFC